MAVKLGLIGCGGVARRHVQAMEDLKGRRRGDFDVTAVCDADENAAQEMAALLKERFGSATRAYSDYRTMLESERLDGVDICLPHGLHHSVAIDSMEAGVHVLCEKPLGITIQACRIMAEAAERTRRILSTAVPHRRQPGQRIAHWVFNESKLIGAPQTFSHYYSRPAPAPQPSTAPVPPRVLWRRNKLMSGGGPVLDSGFHYCDSMRYFFGDVDTVYAQLRSLDGDRSIHFQEAPENAVFVTFAFKSGVVGSWIWNLAAPGAEQHNVVFHGSEGNLVDTTDSRFAIFHLFERKPDNVESGRLVRSDGQVYAIHELETMHLETLGPQEKEALYPGGSTDGFAIEIWEFLEAVRGNISRVEVDGWGGLQSLAIGEAIYESALTGESIAVDDVISGKRSAYQDAINEHWGL